MLKELQREMSLERAEGIMGRVGEGVAAQRVRFSHLILMHAVGVLMRLVGLGRRLMRR